ncbi:dTDP-4-dehydrorhamnose 3,5-epimerase [Rhodococcus sp. D-6]|uniref:dTDP-4-dehydrorhamnose 3,5-epimerase n=1 Tax=Rhodococcus sp. D-6 TaxID=1387842 RepID=A0AAU7USA6_9NOCA|nr:dTDP-4-dehydrorhamnose 3,5-epimerase [Rhodococcus sp. HS-D2]
MEYRELKISGAFEISPRKFGDERGEFLEWFKQETFTDVVGASLPIAQANCSVSEAGVLRGIHYADVPPGQAKYVTCVSGAVFDVVVDLRVGSPTFGQWDSVVLDTSDRRAVFLPEGLGHGFLALEERSTVIYMCSTSYNPENEHEINPLDETIDIDWPIISTSGTPLTYLLSEKDRNAPSFIEMREAGTLPRWTL